MPISLQEVQQLVQKQFPGATIDELEQRPNLRILGTIRWQGFRGMGDGDRNTLVTQKVRNELGLRGINIGVLVPLAPGESL